MVEIGKLNARLGAIGCSEVLLGFLTDDERGELEEIVTDRPQEVERAGRIVGMAHRRAEMRHPGFE